MSFHDDKCKKLRTIITSAYCKYVDGTNRTPRTNRQRRREHCRNNTTTQYRRNDTWCVGWILHYFNDVVHTGATAGSVVKIVHAHQQGNWRLN